MSEVLRLDNLFRITGCELGICSPILLEDY